MKPRPDLMMQTRGDHARTYVIIEQVKRARVREKLTFLINARYRRAWNVSSRAIYQLADSRRLVYDVTYYMYDV